MTETEITARWLRTLSEYVSWIETHGRRPSSSRSAPAEERRLRSWLYGQRRATLSPAQTAILDAVAPGWSQRKTRTWEETYAELTEWVKDNGTQPSVTGADATERRLGRWLYDHAAAGRGLVRSQPVTPERRRKLDAVVPGWDDAADHLSWDERLAQLRHWSDAHSHRPRTRSGDGDERALGRWLNVQRGRFHRGELSAENITELDSAFPGWSAFPSRRQPQSTGEWRQEQYWRQSLDRYVQWVAQHGRPPSATASVTREERNLAMWLSRQRKEARREGFREAKREALDAAIPGWETARQKTWDESYEELVAWVREHGHPPRQAGRDQTEVRLYAWVYKHSATARGINSIVHIDDERRRKLDQIVPGWDQQPPPSAEERARQALPRIIELREQTPPWTFAAIGKEIGESANTTWRWYRDHQREATTLSADNERKPRTWEETFAELSEWIGRHPGKRPSRKASDSTERHLATWLWHQVMAARGKSGRKSVTPEQRIQLDALVPGWDQSMWKRRAEACLPRIIELREQDPPAPWAVIAREVGASVATVKKWHRQHQLNQADGG